jgi:hypothetical protein
MTKIGFAQMNGVAVTAFALCLVIGAFLAVTMHQACADNRGCTARPVPAIRHQGSPAMGESCAFALGKIRRTARPGIVS